MKYISKLVSALITTGIISSPAFAGERYAFLNLRLDFGHEGISQSRLALTSNYSHDDLHFSSIRDFSTHIADITIYSRQAGWNVNLLGNNILSSRSFKLSADQDNGSDQSTTQTIGKTLLISGLAIGGIYLIASKAFEDDADDLAKQSLEDE